ncbi:NADPH-dependent F420 reductase [Holzapfeliella floricola]|nr:NAD(P)-binding domain-containing protein [Holzapfeliella floricola]
MSKIITVIGNGAAGSSIAGNLRNSGFEVKVGVRSPENSVNTISIEQAIQESEEIIIWALPYNAAIDLIGKYENDLKDKIIIDMMNPLKGDMSGVETFNGKSGAQHLQSQLPESHIVQTFNHVDAPVLENPTGAFQFVVGSDKDSVNQVANLAKQMKFDVEVIYDLDRTKETEAFAFLWIYYSAVINQNFTAFLKLHK